ncbi:MAG: ABC transporter permease subunit [Gammaproteobacteria bacterium]|nr:ABC transporter permease subunit [Gammaproteobacteria bacterium]MBU1656450.1 ABC transporter permease subunit [Gammaproteobacteria bacterium]MBU1961474.1 ABC transporter permease subunit [Gammaproteobacteria bacterium]
MPGLSPDQMRPASRRANDKLLPTPAQMVEAVDRMAFQQDRRTGSYPMARDTVSSLKRLLIGVTLAASAGLLLGLNMGLFPGMSATLNPFVTFLSMIPPLAILPILFISFGVDELAKVMLIFIGLFPLITRDIQLAVRKLPGEQITKALTLGASQLELAYRIVLPQILPRLIETVRLSLGAAWLFLIAAEAIAADDGLGYRIFLVRRYLAMDVILPYVLWITLLGYGMDLLLRYLLRWGFPWYIDREGE